MDDEPYFSTYLAISYRYQNPDSGVTGVYYEVEYMFLKQGGGGSVRPRSFWFKTIVLSPTTDSSVSTTIWGW